MLLQLSCTLFYSEYSFEPCYGYLPLFPFNVTYGRHEGKKKTISINTLNEENSYNE